MSGLSWRNPAPTPPRGHRVETDVKGALNAEAPERLSHAVRGHHLARPGGEVRSISVKLSGPVLLTHRDVLYLKPFHLESELLRTAVLDGASDARAHECAQIIWRHRSPAWAA